MYRYVIKRLISLIPVIIGVSIIIFTLLSLTPGDPADTRFGENVSEEVKEQWREEQGLNDPVVVQYFRWMGGIITKGDFGTSYKTDEPVLTKVMDRFPTTLLMAVLLTIIASVIGVFLGVLAAVKQGGLDRFAGKSSGNDRSFHSELLDGIADDSGFCSKFKMVSGIRLVRSEILGAPGNINGADVGCDDHAVHQIKYA